MTDWNTYYKQHMSRPPRDILMRAVSLCKNKNKALDLGAGTLVESNFLLKSGFQNVLAVDNSPEITTFAKVLNDKRLQVQITPFNNLVLEPNTFDLITAQYALPFYGKEGFEIFIQSLITSLKKDGVFVGQLFGERDGWNNPKKNMVFQTKDEALSLLSGLNIVEFKEEEKDGTVASGEPKHWHVFHFIAVK